MNTIYLYLQRMLINYAEKPRMEISRKKALFIISRYLKFMPKMQKAILWDMEQLELIKLTNQRKIKIINIEKSEDIEKGLLVRLITSNDEKTKN